MCELQKKLLGNLSKIFRSLRSRFFISYQPTSTIQQKMSTAVSVFSFSTTFSVFWFNLFWSVGPRCFESQVNTNLFGLNAFGGGPFILMNKFASTVSTENLFRSFPHRRFIMLKPIKIAGIMYGSIKTKQYLVHIRPL